MDLKKLIEWVLMAALSGTGAFIASYVNRMADCIQSMNKSLIELNSKMEVMGTEITHGNEYLHDHEGRLRAIERRGRP